MYYDVPRRTTTSFMTIGSNVTTPLLPLPELAEIEL